MGSGEAEQDRVHTGKRLQLIMKIAFHRRDRHEGHGVEDDGAGSPREPGRDQLGEPPRPRGRALVRGDVEVPAVVEMHNQDVSGSGTRQDLLYLPNGEMLAGYSARSARRPDTFPNGLVTTFPTKPIDRARAVVILDTGPCDTLRMPALRRSTGPFTSV